MRGATGTREGALLVSPHAGDFVVFEGMFEQQNWSLFRSSTVSEAMHVLRENPVPLVITERELPSGDWKDLLFAIRDLPDAPLLVVMSHHADESLWSEVLNLCGHDVLCKPLYPPEALRVFRHAFHRWRAPRQGKLRSALALSQKPDYSSS